MFFMLMTAPAVSPRGTPDVVARAEAPFAIWIMPRRRRRRRRSQRRGLFDAAADKDKDEDKTVVVIFSSSLKRRRRRRRRRRSARVCKKTQREREREREVTSVGETAASCLFLETSTTPHAARKAFKLMDEQNAKDAAVRFFITFFGVFSSSQC